MIETSLKSKVGEIRELVSEVGKVECPNCGWPNLIWRPLGHFPALAWGCAGCRYIEGPPLEKFLEDPACAETVSEHWQAWFAEESEREFCPGPARCDCMEGKR